MSQRFFFSVCLGIDGGIFISNGGFTSGCDVHRYPWVSYDRGREFLRWRLYRLKVQS